MGKVSEADPAKETINTSEEPEEEIIQNPAKIEEMEKKPTQEEHNEARSVETNNSKAEQSKEAETNKEHDPCDQFVTVECFNKMFGESDIGRWLRENYGWMYGHRTTKIIINKIGTTAEFLQKILYLSNTQVIAIAIILIASAMVWLIYNTQGHIILIAITLAAGFYSMELGALMLVFSYLTWKKPFSKETRSGGSGMMIFGGVMVSIGIGLLFTSIDARISIGLTAAGAVLMVTGCTVTAMSQHSAGQLIGLGVATGVVILVFFLMKQFLWSYQHLSSKCGWYVFSNTAYSACVKKYTNALIVEAEAEEFFFNFNQRSETPQIIRKATSGAGWTWKWDWDQGIDLSNINFKPEFDMIIILILTGIQIAMLSHTILPYVCEILGRVVKRKARNDKAAERNTKSREPIQTAKDWIMMDLWDVNVHPEVWAPHGVYILALWFSKEAALHAFIVGVSGYAFAVFWFEFYMRRTYETLGEDDIDKIDILHPDPNKNMQTGFTIPIAGKMRLMNFIDQGTYGGLILLQLALVRAYNLHPIFYLVAGAIVFAIWNLMQREHLRRKYYKWVMHIGIVIGYAALGNVLAALAHTAAILAARGSFDTPMSTLSQCDGLVETNEITIRND